MTGCHQSVIGRTPLALHADGARPLVEARTPASVRKASLARARPHHGHPDLPTSGCSGSGSLAAVGSPLLATKDRWCPESDSRKPLISTDTSTEAQTCECQVRDCPQKISEVASVTPLVRESRTNHDRPLTGGSVLQRFWSTPTLAAIAVSGLILAATGTVAVAQPAPPPLTIASSVPAQMISSDHFADGNARATYRIGSAQATVVALPALIKSR